MPLTPHTHTNGFFFCLLPTRSRELNRAREEAGRRARVFLKAKRQEEMSESYFGGTAGGSVAALGGDQFDREWGIDEYELGERAGADYFMGDNKTAVAARMDPNVTRFLSAARRVSSVSPSAARGIQHRARLGTTLAGGSSGGGGGGGGGGVRSRAATISPRQDTEGRRRAAERIRRNQSMRRQQRQLEIEETKSTMYRRHQRQEAIHARVAARASMSPPSGGNRRTRVRSRSPNKSRRHTEGGQRSPSAEPVFSTLVNDSALRSWRGARSPSPGVAASSPSPNHSMEDTAAGDEVRPGESDEARRARIRAAKRVAAFQRQQEFAKRSHSEAAEEEKKKRAEARAERKARLAEWNQRKAQFLKEKVPRKALPTAAVAGVDGADDSGTPKRPAWGAHVPRKVKKSPSTKADGDASDGSNDGGDGESETKKKNKKKKKRGLGVPSHIVVRERGGGRERGSKPASSNDHAGWVVD